ncbi:MAG: winged helix-turn-helix domain-containing protein [Sphaerochaeta sp.]|jgi:hypothetical protein|nr:winged helix-turn-helix domain-containing protein [Sphaerochaeta sp.]
MSGPVKYPDSFFLDFIKEHKEAHGGESPTIRQVAEKLGINSTSLVAYRVDKLIREGKLVRGQRGWRFPKEVYQATPPALVPYSLEALAILVRFLDSYAIPRLGAMTTGMNVPQEFLDMFSSLVMLYPNEEERAMFLETLEAGKLTESVNANKK